MPSLREDFPLKGTTQRLFLNPTESKTNPPVGKKEEMECASFAGSFRRHLASVMHVCPACSHYQKWSALPRSVLEEVVSLLFRDCGHKQELEKSHGFQELQLYLPTA